ILLVIGWLGGMTLTPRGGAGTGGAGGGTIAAAPGPIPLTLVSKVTRTHVNCSRFDIHGGGKMPMDLGKLPAPLAQHLGHPAAAPDFSSIGYTFAGADK